MVLFCRDRREGDVETGLEAQRCVGVAENGWHFFLPFSRGQGVGKRGHAGSERHGLLDDLFPLLTENGSGGWQSEWTVEGIKGVLCPLQQRLSDGTMGVLNELSEPAFAHGEHVEDIGAKRSPIGGLWNARRSKVNDDDPLLWSPEDVAVVQIVVGDAPLMKVRQNAIEVGNRCNHLRCGKQVSGHGSGRLSVDVLHNKALFSIEHGQIEQARNPCNGFFLKEGEHRSFTLQGVVVWVVRLFDGDALALLIVGKKNGAVSPFSKGRKEGVGGVGRGNGGDGGG